MFRWSALILLLAAAVPPDQEVTPAQIKAIEEKLIAPCCWRQPVSIHESGAADEVRQGIRSMLAKGMSEEEILDQFVSQYGERILSSPRAEGFNLLSYILPFAALVLGALGVFVIFRRYRAPEPAAQPPSSEKIPERYAQLLEKELRGE